MDEPIGGKSLTDIMNHVADKLMPLAAGWDQLLCPGGVYRMCDGGDYVYEDVWDSYWAKRPEWQMKAWQLTDNGQYSFEDVARMSIPEIEEAFNDPDFCPEFTYYTEIYEEDIEENIASMI